MKNTRQSHLGAASRRPVYAGVLPLRRIVLVVVIPLADPPGITIPQHHCWVGQWVLRGWQRVVFLVGQVGSRNNERRCLVGRRGPRPQVSLAYCTESASIE